MAQLVFPQPGDLIANKYRLIRLLGQGGMGVVYEASHAVTEKHFAIKYLLPDPARSDDAVARFVREAQAAGRCEHRNLVSVYDIDREDDSFFMIMELLKGQSLADRLTQYGRIHYREACRLLVPCVEGVHEVHRAGIIHRDLKPGNLFICEARGRELEMAKVLDFGVSRFVVPSDAIVEAKTRNGALVGTPFYMAPEQMRGRSIDARVDVYSMGVTLYEVFSGVRPYDATTYGDLLFKIAQTTPAPLSTLVPEIPQGLSDVVKRAMAYEAEARFANMEELANALLPFIDHAASTSSQTSVVRVPGAAKPQPQTPWVAEPGPAITKRRTKKAWLAVGAVATAASALATFTFLDTRTAATQHEVLPKPVQRTDIAAITAAASSNAAPVPPSAAADAGTTTDPGAGQPANKTTPVTAPVHVDRKVRAPKAAPPVPEEPDSLGTPTPYRREDLRTRPKNRAPAIMKRADF
ncbi:MAG: hypothetical protein RL701_4836 [Pseudomonadota bacterium]